MKLSTTGALIVGVWATGALSKDNSKPCFDCQDPYFAGFRDVPGIASLCNNAVRPTTTVIQSVTGYTTVTKTM
jgi:hypothetical protein